MTNKKICRKKCFEKYEQILKYSVGFIVQCSTCDKTLVTDTIFNKNGFCECKHPKGDHQGDDSGPPRIIKKTT